jgi:hypothetical protein
MVALDDVSDDLAEDARRLGEIIGGFSCRLVARDGRIALLPAYET